MLGCDVDAATGFVLDERRTVPMRDWPQQRLVTP
jgi:hypothetical protein